MFDPTREEMLEIIKRECGWMVEISDFDIECGIYWFCNDYHGGQSSNLYSVLSTSKYNPGIFEDGPDYLSQFVYDALEDNFYDYQRKI